ILRLDHNGLPHEVYFRDCQGTGYEQEKYKDLKLDIAKNGNDVPKEIGNQLVGYYLIINSTFSIIAALSRSSLISEKELVKILRDFLASMPQMADHSFVNYLLHSDALDVKDNF